MRIEWLGGSGRDDTVAPGDCSRLSDEIEALLRDIAGRIGRRYVPFQLALPDPLVDAVVLELEELPGSSKARSELVRWHLAKHLHLDGQSLQITTQYLGQSGDRHLLLGLAVSADLLEAVNAAFAGAGLPPAVIDMAACYRHNYFAPQFEPGSGALVCLEPDYWSVSLWDQSGRLRQVRSRWRDGALGNTGEYRRVAAEVERTVMAYVHGAPERRIERLYAACSSGNADALCEALNERSRETCTALSLPSLPHGQGTTSLAAIASASCR